MFTKFKFRPLGPRAAGANKMPPRGLPLGGLQFIKFTSHSFRPVFQTYEVPRLVGSGRRTLNLLHHGLLLSLGYIYIISHLTQFINRQIAQTFCLSLGHSARDLTLAVNQTHVTPTQYTDLITGSADCHGLSLGCYAVALVDVVDTFAIPYATSAAIGLYRIDCFPGGFALYALGGHLPAALVGYDLAILKGEAVVIGELADGSNVNHNCSSLSLGGLLPSLSVYIIPQNPSFVKGFWESFLIFFTVALRR